jgi:hypothetical protein
VLLVKPALVPANPRNHAVHTVHVYSRRHPRSQGWHRCELSGVVATTMVATTTVPRSMGSSSLRPLQASAGFAVMFGVQLCPSLFQHMWLDTACSIRGVVLHCLLAEAIAGFSKPSYDAGWHAPSGCMQTTHLCRSLLQRLAASQDWIKGRVCSHCHLPAAHLCRRVEGKETPSKEVFACHHTDTR